MTSVQNPSALHDRSTRGETLSPAEQAALDTWYAENDRHESAMLGLEHENAPEADDLASLRSQVATAQETLYRSIERVRQLSDENEQIRREARPLYLILPD